MTPRTILYTGKGGVGKTSVAACTARACAASGLRTLVISTDPAHSLSESLGAELGPEPSAIEDRLWGQEVNAQEEMERHWSGVQDWLGEVFVERGIDRISAQELTVPPGMDELFSLLRLQSAHQSPDWDAIIVDCAPTGETLRLLSFPDVARWWIEKVFPDKMVIGEAMRTFTYLNLYGYLTDAVLVNRVFPSDVGDYFAGWRRVQEEHLELVRSAFAPVPVLWAPYFDQEVLGAEMLDRLAGALFGPGGHDPAAVLHDRLTQELRVSEDGAGLRLMLPFAHKGDISLKKIGLELIVGVDGQRRTIILPPALAAFQPSGATFEDGALEVTFRRARDAEPA
ncbi:MAG: ArsA family ATPase [Solirubrobacterales bacterium]|nr:ArsA family ATPase [Solirubrobacterales bacterium]